jgi:hypothetical protein
MKPWLLVLAFSAAAFGISTSHLLAVPTDNVLAICIKGPNSAYGRIARIHQNGLDKFCSAFPGEAFVLTNQSARPGQECEWSAWGQPVCADFNLAMGTASIPDPPHLVLGMAAFIGLAFYGWGGRRRSPSTPE